MSGKELRLRRLFPRGDSRLFAVPLDHSLTMGPLPGLQDLSSTVATLQEGGVEAIIVHKGALAAVQRALRPTTWVGVHLSASTTLGPQPERKYRAGTVADAVRRGADFVSVQVNFGTEQEGPMLQDLGAVAEESEDLGIPLLCMAYVRKPGRELDPESLAHACRASVDLGADIVKTSYPGSPEEFAKMCRTTPVPVLIGGGVRLDNEAEFLKIVADSVRAGGAGICIGRNVFQSPDPVRLGRKVKEILRGAGELPAPDGR